MVMVKKHCKRGLNLRDYQSFKGVIIPILSNYSNFNSKNSAFARVIKKRKKESLKWQLRVGAFIGPRVGIPIVDYS